jgi:hypothetical protein
VPTMLTALLAAAGRAPRDRAVRDRRRDLHPRLPGDGRLPGRPGGDLRGHRRRRLAAHRRPGVDGRARLLPDHGPAQGDDHPGRGEHLPARDRGRAGQPPGCGRGRGGGGAGPVLGRGGGRGDPARVRRGRDGAGRGGAGRALPGAAGCLQDPGPLAVHPRLPAHLDRQDPQGRACRPAVGDWGGGLGWPGPCRDQGRR